MARIILRREGTSQEYKISGVVTVGRQSTNDIVVLEEKASRQHARITSTGKQFVYEDLGSSNGSQINGVRIQKHTLKNGDVIHIGKATLTFHEDTALNLEGTTLGNYRIHNKIGQGGMGAVYKATQISMDRIVALKVLKDELTSDSKFVKQFLQEARTAGKLNHPNVVKVHDFGEANGTYYFSMEYVDGETVEDVLKREGKLSVNRTLEIVEQTAAALQHAHKLGIIHKDVKPQNILCDRRGLTKLTDLGLARTAEKEATDRRRGSIMGTPYYMAPETAQLKKADARTDIYSLGASFFHMLTGRVPYEGANSLAVIAKHVTDPVPNPKQFDVTIPEPVCRLVELMMAKNPSTRPANASAVLKTIEQLKARKTPPIKVAPAQPKPAPAKIPPIAPRSVRVVKVESGSPVAYMLIGALVVGILGFGAWMMLSGSSQRGSSGSSTSHGGRDDPSGVVVDDSPMSYAAATRKLDAAERMLESGNTANVVDLLRDVMKRCDDPTARDRARQLWERTSTGGGVSDPASDRKAAQQLSEIKQQLRDNPAGTSYVARQLRLLIATYPNTPAADEARRLFKGMMGDRRIDELDEFVKPRGSGGHNSTPTGQGTSTPITDTTPPANPGTFDDREVRTAYEAARDSSIKAEGKTDYHSARAAWTRFITRFRGHPRANEAAELRDQLDTRIRRSLGRTYDRALTLSRRGQYSQATDLLQEIILKDPIGSVRSKAEQLYDLNQTAAQRIHNEAITAATPLLEGYSFDEAARSMRTSARRLAGTEWERDLIARAESAEICRDLIYRFKEQLEKKRGAAPKLNRKEGGRPVTLLMQSATEQGIMVREGRAQRRISWGLLSAKELVTAFSAFRLTPEDRLGLGALFLMRNERQHAK
jgi:serine/threonine-protein kinase